MVYCIIGIIAFILGYLTGNSVTTERWTHAALSGTEIKECGAAYVVRKIGG